MQFLRLKNIRPPSDSPLVTDWLPFEKTTQKAESIGNNEPASQEVPDTLNGKLPPHSPQNQCVIKNDNEKGKRDKQIDEVCKIAEQLEYQNLLAIPEGGKAAIKAECLKNTALFTDAGFDHAWKVANKRGVISMQDKEKYL
jgi:hypothetical protein